MWLCGMNEKDNVTIPYYVHEAEMARERKHSKMLFVLCLVIFMMLILTNGAWIYYENQFVDTTTEQTVTQDVDTSCHDQMIKLTTVMM